MNLRFLKRLGLVLGLSLTAIHAADPIYWQDFEKAKKQGVTLIQHIQNLSTITQSDTDQTKNDKKNALAYFLATGGKHGFRKSPATEAERDILVKALTVTAYLHYSVEDAPVLDLVDIRTSYGLNTQDTIVQNHLAQAHAVIGYALCANSYHAQTQRNTQIDIGDLKDNIYEVYLNPVMKLSKTLKQDYWLNRFVQGFNQPIAKSITAIIFPSFKEQIKDEAVKNIQALLANALIKPLTAKRSRLIHLANGGYIERTSDGKISTNIFGGSIIAPIINFNGIQLNAGWSDEEFSQRLSLSGLTAVSFSD